MNLPLQHETIDFRNLIYKNLFFNERIKLKPNFTKDQLNFFKNYIRNKQFKVVICDKNIGWAILDNELYKNLAFEHLNENSNSYKQLSEDPLNNTIKEINDELKRLNKFGHLSDSFFNKLTLKSNECKNGKLKLLPKLHKKKFGIRAIINCSNHPTSKISYLLNQILQTYVQNSESYIKD